MILLGLHALYATFQFEFRIANETYTRMDVIIGPFANEKQINLLGGAAGALLPRNQNSSLTTTIESKVPLMTRADADTSITGHELVRLVYQKHCDEVASVLGLDKLHATDKAA